MNGKLRWFLALGAVVLLAPIALGELEGAERERKEQEVAVRKQVEAPRREGDARSERGPEVDRRIQSLEMKMEALRAEAREVGDNPERRARIIAAMEETERLLMDARERKERPGNERGAALRKAQGQLEKAVAKTRQLRSKLEELSEGMRMLEERPEANRENLERIREAIGDTERAIANSSVEVDDLEVFVKRLRGDAPREREGREVRDERRPQPPRSPRPDLPEWPPFIRDHAPDLAETLQERGQRQPEQTRELVVRLREIGEMARQNPGEAERQLEQMRWDLEADDLNRRSAEIGERLKHEKNPEEREALKRHLHEILNQVFNMRQEQRERHIHALEGELERNRQILRERGERRDEIIERRIHELTGNPEIFGW